MNEWDDERATIAGRQIESNIPPKVSPVSERDRKRLLMFAVVVPVAVLIALFLNWVRGQ